MDKERKTTLHEDKKDILTNHSNYLYYEWDWTPVMVNEKTWESYKFLNWKWIIWPSISIIQDEYNRITKEKFNDSFPWISDELINQKKKDEIIKNNIKDVLNIKTIEADFNILLNNYNDNDKIKIQKAYKIMKLIHNWQYRDEWTPYYTHCVSTAIGAMQYWLDYNQIIVALLHDAIEDWSDYNKISKEIENSFGKDILNSILKLSKKINWIKKSNKEYFDLLKDTKELEIKALDRLSNIRSLFFCPDKEKTLRYIKETEENILPMLEHRYDDIASKIKETISYIKDNKDLYKNGGLLNLDIKIIEESKTELIKNLVSYKDEIEWEFGNKKIKLEVFPIKWSNKVMINIHWTYWSKYWSSGKYMQFAKSLQKNNISNSVLFETSRKAETPKSETFEEKMKNFEWKSFNQELNDCKKVLDYIIENSESLFWIKKDKLEITINWNSLWWILALMLAKEYAQIKSISTVWSWLSLHKREIPILNSHPSLSELKPYLESYNWKFLLQYWTNDEIFDNESFKKLLKGLKNAETSFVKMIWVDHTFKKVDGKNSNMPYRQVYNNVKSLIDWQLVWWEIHLEDKNQGDSDVNTTPTNIWLSKNFKDSQEDIDFFI